MLDFGVRPLERGVISDFEPLPAGFYGTPKELYQGELDDLETSKGRLADELYDYWAEGQDASHIEAEISEVRERLETLYYAGGLVVDEETA